ncbi:MAG TPA: UvrD-helicase domain-containing protein [Thermoanaerobaculia bacterium]|nr:UvrD-helicase domain-containing protein [Thermoanaerobaculia bacterium]
MSERRPTPEQDAAIGARAHRVLVEAGAGTGKTGVMVERYCRLVCERGVALDAILAITFTEKAAAELRHRVRAELTARAAAGSERAAELLPGLGAAWITTIHGFCHRVLAAHPVAAGVDPRFAVLDPAETQRAAREAFDDALEEFLGAEDAAREETVAGYGIDSLRGAVVGVHAELRSRGVRSPRLPDPPAPDVAAAIGGAAEAAAEALAELGETSKWRPFLERAVAVLGERGEAIELDEISSLRSGSNAQAMNGYRAAIDAAIARVAEAGEGGEAYAHIAELLRLFSAGFEAAKERRRGIDFEDMQLLAAELLERDAIGSAYRERFSEVMIDEFQDTNRLQLRLVESLRGPGTDLVVVGDLLQSIYGFRHADLDVFREEREAVAAEPGGETIELSGNFRSRPEVIAAVNALGASLLGDSYRPLSVGAAPGEPAQGPAGPPVELLLTAKAGWEELELEPPVDAGTAPQYLAEARFLAARLRELVDEGVPRGEVVVLLRAFTHLDAYEDALSRAGLRPYVVGGRGYWSQQQVSDVCALLATIANPLDDQALLGALASPACGVSPDTLWLLRAASGERRHLWPAVRLIGGRGEAELESPELLEEIEAGDRELLSGFVATIGELRSRATRLSLAELIDRAVTATGYDLAVLLKPAGEARFANVRKLMQLAAEFEAGEGRDLRGLLDFLAFREQAADEAAAATAAEDHDGVRIMSVHRAKGLEFGVVAVPHLDRSLLAGSWPPLLTLGHGEDRRVGMQLRRLGARAVNLYAHEALREETQEREAEEGLRLFHVAATRARDRLILSGVVREKAAEQRPSTSVLERVVEGFEIGRDADSSVPIPPPPARPGLEQAFTATEIAVRANLPSPEGAAALVARHPAPGVERGLGAGPAPLLARRPPAVPSRQLSYTALSAYEECGYRFQLEHIFGLGSVTSGQDQTGCRSSSRIAEGTATSPGAREERRLRGRVVHALLEWSQGHDWREPPPELVRAEAAAEGLDPDSPELATAMLDPVRGWLGSALLRERVAGEANRVRAEVPLLLGVGGSVLRGSIDLLLESDGAPPLVVDYKTDPLDGSDPEAKAHRYETQRAIYALAVSEALGAEEVEVAYVFLERPDDPATTVLGPAELIAARAELEETITRIGSGEFPVAAPDERSWSLCRGCPALGRLCSGPSGT